LLQFVQTKLETFWESGDEDRNKTKFIALKCPPGLLGRCLAVHVDNGRDMANKISSLTFRAGKTSAAAAADDGQQAAAGQPPLTVLKTVEVESRYAGWIHCFLTDSVETTAAINTGGGGSQHLLLRVEMRGPDNTVRLRQVKLIGRCAADDDLLAAGGAAAAAASPVALIPNRAESARIQQANCEAETLRVFRLITSQVRLHNRVFVFLLWDKKESFFSVRARMLFCFRVLAMGCRLGTHFQ
jgi:E3 ubiquitin-protein ligase MYCBP2